MSVDRPSSIVDRRSPIPLLVVLFSLYGFPSFAAVDDFLGKNIVEVHLRSNDVEMRDPFLAEVVETKVGRPLTMAAPITEAATSLCQRLRCPPCGRLKAIHSAAIEAAIAMNTDVTNNNGS